MRAIAWRRGFRATATATIEVEEAVVTREQWNAALADARREARDEVLHEVNRVFCGGFSSGLGLEYMRDMHDSVVLAPLRARIAELEGGINSFLLAVETMRVSLAPKEGA